MKFLHELKDIKDLFEVIANERKILPYLVEKDYWIMHALWGLKHQGFVFELKGGTSLSKAYGIIERFSEDLDIRINPSDPEIKTGRNNNNNRHVELRRTFFEELRKKINIPDMIAVRDFEYDDEKMRNAGIVLEYPNLFSHIDGVKKGILLELGFDQTEPNQRLSISSWIYDRVLRNGVSIYDNLARDIPCYLPEYTFVEKLQAVSTKVRKQQESGSFSKNFMRHFYDIYALLEQPRVINFLGTDEYVKHKEKRFRRGDEQDISKNLAFNLDKNEQIFNIYKKKYEEIKPLLTGDFYPFEMIYENIIKFRYKM